MYNQMPYFGQQTQSPHTTYGEEIIDITNFLFNKLKERSY